MSIKAEDYLYLKKDTRRLIVAPGVLPEDVKKQISEMGIDVVEKNIKESYMIPTAIYRKNKTRKKKPKKNYKK